MTAPDFGPQPKSSFERSPSRDEIAFFNENGFLSVDRITTDEEVEWLREVYDMLFSGQIELLPGALVTDAMTRMDQQRGRGEAVVVLLEARRMLAPAGQISNEILQ